MEEREKRTYEFLDNLGVPYEKYEHEAIMTIEAAEELDKKMGLEICKKKFNTGKVSKQINVPRMTFAGDDYMLEYLDIRPGSVSPLGLMNDKGNNVNLLIDEDVLNMEKIAVHPCVNTATLVINTKDLIEKILPACGHSYTKVTV